MDLCSGIDNWSHKKEFQSKWWLGSLFYSSIFSCSFFTLLFPKSKPKLWYYTKYLVYINFHLTSSKYVLLLNHVLLQRVCRSWCLCKIQPMNGGLLVLYAQSLSSQPLMVFLFLCNYLVSFTSSNIVIFLSIEASEHIRRNCIWINDLHIQT